MIKKCIGCGAVLQSENMGEEGYIKKEKILTANYCERCFKITHYGNSFLIEKQVDINEFINKINNQKKPVIYLLDLTCISNTTLELLKNIKTKIYLVLTKRDLIPKSVKDKKLISYIKENYINIEDIMIVSSNKMWNIDNLYNKLKKDNIKEAYVLGYTNSGKSTLINSLLKSKGKNPSIVTSMVPNTTCELINIDLDGFLTIIDTPGFINENSIVNFLNIKEYLKLIPKKEIKPKIYNLRPGFTIIIENIIRIENNTEENVNLIFYLKNELKYKKVKITTSDELKILTRKTIELNGSEDIIIEGLGFIKCPKKTKLTIYINNDKIITKRKKMI